MEVLLSVRYIKVVIALLVVAIIAWQRARVVRCFDNVVGVGVLHGFVIPVIQRDGILMVNVKVCRILIQKESTGATWRKRDRLLQMRIELHVFLAENGVTAIGLL